jgi:CDP-paratose 2-epimerase
VKTAGADRTILITGGGGFIGSNLAARLLLAPDVHVRIYDNLSRTGVVHNLEWLQSIATRGKLEIIQGDVRDASALQQAARGVSEIYHFAAQVAVTTSIHNPRDDFHVNALGTFNVLEAARLSGTRPFLLFTSTNKVYGSLESISVAVKKTRYHAVDRNFAGVSEAGPLDFHSPYGCSKGAADQYVRDYARMYALPTVVFRMSCIAGPRQFGNEDQGWVAHFLYSVLSHEPITVYGDGFQVRDVLHVYDLLDAMLTARSHRNRTQGEVYNIGGGLKRAISVIDMLHAIALKTGQRLDLRYSSVRPGDQPLYISDTTKFERHTGWQPNCSLSKTLEDIHAFWQDNRERIMALRPSSASRELLPEEVA